jgi:hypothetical protein
MPVELVGNVLVESKAKLVLAATLVGCVEVLVLDDDADAGLEVVDGGVAGLAVVNAAGVLDVVKGTDGEVTSTVPAMVVVSLVVSILVVSTKSRTQKPLTFVSPTMWWNEISIASSPTVATSNVASKGCANPTSAKISNAASTVSPLITTSNTRLPGEVTKISAKYSVTRYLPA